MVEQEAVKRKKHINVGLLAHVDAGKTTLSESMLYLAGRIRTLGRVDHGNAYLDTDALEKARGITIFSKQARLSWKDMELVLLDTPGHVDFSTEMERTLQVLDYAILVINGMDGVQSHTQTVWKLLKRYRIPVFLFINKMDQNGTDQEAVLSGLKKRLSTECISFMPQRKPMEWMEEIACCDEVLLEQFLENGTVEKAQICQLIAERKIFPCYFGSALKLTGVDSFLDGIYAYTQRKVYPDAFGAKVYKITRDEQGNRLTHLKVTGNSLQVKSLVGTEKINQIRLYAGKKFDTVEAVYAGDICAVTGLNESFAGQGLGFEKDSLPPYLEPVMDYQIILQPGSDVHQVYGQLKQLKEEDPQLKLYWKETQEEIHVKLMGEVQLEILERLIWERFQLKVEFGTGKIVYKETIADTVEGVGHFEPLRHYAEVHLLLEPGERGSGLTFFSNCREDVLDLNWQRLILTHLMEREHPGVLTGSAITDIKITLLAGKAHLKHTEGGDFRQATYRAVRQGLKQAESILLEPYYGFRLEIPQQMVGRAMADIQRMQGSFQQEIVGDMAVLTGAAPVVGMNGYQREVSNYTKGEGRFFCSFKGYEPCHNAEAVCAQIGYDSESDLENPTGSVFCSHGAGTYVNWDAVFQYMHLPNWLKKGTVADKMSTVQETNISQTGAKSGADKMYGSWENDRELEAIFEKTFGKVERKGVGDGLGYETKRTEAQRSENIRQAALAYKANHPVNRRQQEKYLLVDGYNVIFAWEELKALAQSNLESARGRLMDILCNYQGFMNCVLIVVFDAYKVKGNPGEVVQYHNIHVVYTKEAETADMYIEKVTKEIARDKQVTVVTSDGLEQLIVTGHGASRMSSREFLEEVERLEEKLREEYIKEST